MADTLTAHHGNFFLPTLRFQLASSGAKDMVRVDCLSFVQFMVEHTGLCNAAVVPSKAATFLRGCTRELAQSHGSVRAALKSGVVAVG
eukprot:1131179-Alexandrium_andersonii.AAC.1